MSQNQKLKNDLQLILASGSPRRKDLLAKAGFSFHVFSVKVSESLEKNLTVNEQILNIARRKAKSSLLAYKSLKPQGFLMLSADTMVVIDNEPIGKPDDPDQAVEILSRLSGKNHEVKTGVVLVEGPINAKNAQNLSLENLDLRQLPVKMVEGISTTTVTFKHLSEKEIRDYVATGEPMDKAGAYGIQGSAQNFVDKISGHFDNVVGLPMELVFELLRQGDWI